MTTGADGLTGNLRRQYRSAIVALGRPWVFWPVVLFGGVLVAGPRYGLALWLLTLLIAGPGSSLAIHAGMRSRGRAYDERPRR